MEDFDFLGHHLYIVTRFLSVLCSMVQNPGGSQRLRSPWTHCLCGETPHSGGIAALAVERKYLHSDELWWEPPVLPALCSVFSILQCHSPAKVTDNMKGSIAGLMPHLEVMM